MGEWTVGSTHRVLFTEREEREREGEIQRAHVLSNSPFFVLFHSPQWAAPAPYQRIPLIQVREDATLINQWWIRITCYQSGFTSPGAHINDWSPPPPSFPQMLCELLWTVETPGISRVLILAVQRLSAVFWRGSILSNVLSNSLLLSAGLSDTMFLFMYV